MIDPTLNTRIQALVADFFEAEAPATAPRISRRRYQEVAIVQLWLGLRRLVEDEGRPAGDVYRLAMDAFLQHWPERAEGAFSSALWARCHAVIEKAS